MKRSRWVPMFAVVACCAGTAGCLAPEGGESEASADPTPSPESVASVGIAGTVLSKLNARVPVTVLKIDVGPDWVRIKLRPRKGPHPMTIDLLASRYDPPSRIVFLLPGSGLDFDSDFFTPDAHNIAHFMRQHDYLVVGYSPREDGVPDDTSDLSFMAGWGMAQHRADIHAVVSAVTTAIDLPYELLGHSAGALAAADYAATHPGPDLAKIVMLDIPSFDPATQPQAIANAQATRAAYDQLLAGGFFADSATRQFQELCAAVDAAPMADSGVPRDPLPGNFTVDGLLHFAAINVKEMPGATTPITGLTDTWEYVQGAFAGTYTFDTDPTKDQFAFTKTPRAVACQALARAGSGLYPVASLRDYYGQLAFAPGSTIAWGDIQTKVVWINSELGFGTAHHGATLVQAGGNPDVHFSVVPGYAHADVAWGSGAHTDVWPLFL